MCNPEGYKLVEKIEFPENNIVYECWFNRGIDWEHHFHIGDILIVFSHESSEGSVQMENTKTGEGMI